jgi:hypothetical protein
LYPSFQRLTKQNQLKPHLQRQEGNKVITTSDDGSAFISMSIQWNLSRFPPISKRPTRVEGTGYTTGPNHAKRLAMFRRHPRDIAGFVIVAPVPSVQKGVMMPIVVTEIPARCMGM